MRRPGRRRRAGRRARTGCSGRAADPRWVDGGVARPPGRTRRMVGAVAGRPRPGRVASSHVTRSSRRCTTTTAQVAHGVVARRALARAGPDCETCRAAPPPSRPWPRPGAREQARCDGDATGRPTRSGTTRRAVPAPTDPGRPAPTRTSSTTPSGSTVARPHVRRRDEARAFYHAAARGARQVAGRLRGSPSGSSTGWRAHRTCTWRLLAALAASARRLPRARRPGDAPPARVLKASSAGSSCLPRGNDCARSSGTSWWTRTPSTVTSPRRARTATRLNLNLLGEAVLDDTEAAASWPRCARSSSGTTSTTCRSRCPPSRAEPSDVGHRGQRRPRRRPPAPLRGRRGARHLRQPRHGGVPRPRADRRMFEYVAAHAPLRTASSGIALQAYLPDAADAFDPDRGRSPPVASTAAGRASGAARQGRQPRAMGCRGGELHGWAQAPYPSKALVDAAYLRLVDRALDPALTRALRVGVASRSTSTTSPSPTCWPRPAAWGARRRDAAGAWHPRRPARCATTWAASCSTPRSSRAASSTSPSPTWCAASRNAAEENFLHAAFAGGDAAMDAQESAFRAAWAGRDLPARPASCRRACRGRRAAGHVADRRSAPDGGVTETPGFADASDTDPAAAEAAQVWARGLVARDVAPPPGTSRSGRRRTSTRSWPVPSPPPTWATPPERRAAISVPAVALEQARGDLVATMVHEGVEDGRRGGPRGQRGRRLRPLLPTAPTGSPTGLSPGRCTARPASTVVTPPWNFPVAVPVGSVLAVARGRQPVLVKPAPATPAAPVSRWPRSSARSTTPGAPAGTLTVVLSPEGDVGRRLVTHPDVARRPHQVDRDRPAVRRVARRPRRARRDVREERPRHRPSADLGLRRRRPRTVR